MLMQLQPGWDWEQLAMEQVTRGHHSVKKLKRSQEKKPHGKDGKDLGPGTEGGARQRLPWSLITATYEALGAKSPY